MIFGQQLPMHFFCTHIDESFVIRKFHAHFYVHENLLVSKEKLVFRSLLFQLKIKYKASIFVYFIAHYWFAEIYVFIYCFIYQVEN